jgi:hypothetical protein
VNTIPECIAAEILERYTIFSTPLLLLLLLLLLFWSTLAFRLAQGLSPKRFL